jgi:hypothetical protein
MPSTSRICSAGPNEKRPEAPSRRCSDLSSIAASLERRHQVERALLVLQEQVLGVAARDLPAQGLGFLDREQRRVAHGRMRDCEPVEKANRSSGVAGMVKGDAKVFWQGRNGE